MRSTHKQMVFTNGKMRRTKT